MSTLREVIEAVKEENLTKSDLEKYHLTLTNIYSLIVTRKADLEKAEALFLNEKEGSEATRKRMWKATKEGQELITITAQKSVASKWLQSVTSRLYARYN